jgi:hypothetical protein
VLCPATALIIARSLSESWERQALLNIVKLRHLDSPVAVDVGQIVSGYTLETVVSPHGTLERGSDSLALGDSGQSAPLPLITMPAQ